ncbi:translocation/assembly module TamB domain-containing protein [Sphingomicrobium nitratireducens]|uniref:translocation/assembly module TamB domain-containing protein n=1 Tax=Sphingomicrobium nitratireducens TaxID=2964666 RepID=UPI00223E9B22|nr:translocation/assembly module TamB domain-containing protein [Sphingomicrobium nitratireducens]
MAEADPTAPRQRAKKGWGRRLLNEFIVLLLALAVIAAGALVLVDTGPGHRFIADRIASMDLGGGVRVRIGRIEGSIYDRMRLRNVVVSDPEGVFLTAPEVTLEWAPGAWLYDKLHVDELSAPLVTLERLPRTRPSGEDKPILPGFDVHVGKLEIEKLVLAEGVTGTARSGRVSGAVDIRAGRAMAELDLLVEGGDAVKLALDAAPDEDKFDLSLKAQAPADGLLPALLGVKAPLSLTLDGDGTWAKWAGEAALDLGDTQALRLAIEAREGVYALDGRADPSPFLDGVAARLTRGGVRIDGRVGFDRRVLDGELTLASRALSLVARGGVDLGDNRFDDLRVGAELAQPSALSPGLSGTPWRATMTLNGAMASARYAYRLRADRLGIDNLTFVGAQVEGQGTRSKPPVRVPLNLTARQLLGAGPEAEDILADLSVRGGLLVTDARITGKDLRLISRRLRATLDLDIDLKRGSVVAALNGALPAYEVPGLGRVDVTADLDLVPGAGGMVLTGTARAQVTRFDNGFLANVAGGNPVVTTRLRRGPDGVLHFTDTRLVAPKLTLSGSGMRRRDGTFLFEGLGEHEDYGPLTLTVDGNISRPAIGLVFERPNAALGLEDVVLDLAPSEAGFDFAATGGSRFGPFTANGAILLPAGGEAALDITSLKVAGSEGSGRLRIVEGGLEGTLRLAGGEIGGTVGVQPAAGGGQRIALNLVLDNADFPGPPVMRFGSGTVKATLLLGAEGGMGIDGTLDARRVDIAGADVARLKLVGALQDGRGTIKADMAGRRGSAFELALEAAVAPERVVVRGNGSLDRRRLRLTKPAVLVPDGAGGWALEGAEVAFGRGRASLSASLGSRPHLDARLKAMPLAILDLLQPDMELGGTADGTLSLDLGKRPEGAVDLKVRGLTRSGLVLASRPIDVAIKGKLANGNAGVRAVAAADGKVVGRAQARFAPLPDAPLGEALMRAPMVAQLRYDGPADTLWRLSGIELFDLTGPLAAGVDARGSLLNPQIAGSLKTDGARIESPVSGTVVEKISARGRFNGAQLTLSSIKGTTPGGGSVTGSGTLTFVGGTSAIDMKFDARKAVLLDRDDIGATVTGPLAIRSSGTGGTISGTLALDEGRFQLGQAGTVAKIPRIDVVERGRPDEEVITRAELSPWTLDIDVAGGPLQVSGLGIESRWRTDLAIGGTLSDPRLNGEADLIQGDYDFAGRNFRLSEGKIRFRGRTPPDPLLDIEADAEVQGLQATVLVQGTGLEPRISFTSIPALPEDELLSRILFGTSITNLSAAEALQLGAAVASLQAGGGGLDPINAIRKAVGLDRLRILPADVATGQETAIAAGKYITRKLYVEVITDGQGYTATQAEYQVTRWLSILSTISSIGRASANVRVSKDY